MWYNATYELILELSYQAYCMATETYEDDFILILVTTYDLNYTLYAL